MDHFPDHVLFQVFDYLPVSEVISTVPRVCQRWFALRHSARLHRRSLALMVEDSFGVRDQMKRISFYNDSGNPRLETFSDKNQDQSIVGVVSFDQNPLKVDLLTKVGVSQLLTSFANIHTLEVLIGDLDEEDTLNHFLLLLNGFSAKLTTLKLMINLGLVSETSVDLPRFVGCLNQLPHLRRLTLELHNDYGELVELCLQKGQSSLSVLSQLIEFNYYCSPSSIDGIVDALNRYALTNEHLQTVSLAIDLEPSELVEFSRKIPKSLARKFRFLSVYLSKNHDSRVSDDDLEAVRRGLTHFDQISSISLWLYDNWLMLHPRRFARLLEPVRERLTYVRLNFDLGDLDGYESELDVEEAKDQCYLPSLRVLALIITPFGLVVQPDIDALDGLARVFSTVERVRLYLDDMPSKPGDLPEVVQHLVDRFPKRPQICCEPSETFA